jgi:catechol 2,3-dioxygenase-like lactoylglutathione lyase family enzyme
MDMLRHTLTAIVPSNNLDTSAAFYRKLGFEVQNRHPNYWILSDGNGGELHLTQAVEDWLVPGRNPFGLYFYTEKVDELAAVFGRAVIHPPEKKPWGMYEFAVSDPDETLIRVGKPAHQEGPH